MASFANVPQSASPKPAPFQVAISDEQIAEFQQLLRLSKVGPDTFEGRQIDRRYGVTRDWLIQAKAEWEKFNWRACENRINAVPNYTMPVPDTDGVTFNIHFIGLFSAKEDAVPVLFLHGWPGNILEFIPIISILQQRYTPETLPYHIIVPSLPGYAFSSPAPLFKDFQIQDVARVMNTLMEQLGFSDGYIVQGGDIGSKIARIIAVEHASCKAIHVNFCIMPKPEGTSDLPVNQLEQQGLDRAFEFKRVGSGYALEHATKPSTIGLVLATNPLALLAWIGEKFLDWTDDDPSMDEILSSVTLYWFTETFPRSMYPYRQLFTPGVIGAHEMPKWHIKKPFGFSWFPKELAPIPRSWAATTADDLCFYRQHEKGGHFAALERPEVLLQDLEDFIKQVWKN
ncbi:alpha/beta-hydrolase [Rhizodiscina lignyota]|uniref:Alpha/beta-hydrolase n=1 Tax=Rhizodiscina lignyota TaxID=1504668 RepID=A0A9P4M722_9PEZI|nr:alpha/beta-hydrolase [Rhizodiscina lignyota]